jgi:hypothetical protein
VVGGTGCLTAAVGFSPALHTRAFPGRIDPGNPGGLTAVADGFRNLESRPAWLLDVGFRLVVKFNCHWIERRIDADQPRDS